MAEDALPFNAALGSVYIHGLDLKFIWKRATFQRFFGGVFWSRKVSVKRGDVLALSHLAVPSGYVAIHRRTTRPGSTSQTKPQQGGELRQVTADSEGVSEIHSCNSYYSCCSALSG